MLLEKGKKITYLPFGEDKRQIRLEKNESELDLLKRSSPEERFLCVIILPSQFRSRLLLNRARRGFRAERLLGENRLGLCRVGSTAKKMHRMLGGDKKSPRQNASEMRNPIAGLKNPSKMQRFPPCSLTKYCRRFKLNDYGRK